MLRPPTFDRLREHLHEHPHTYHILHFDGHGAYGTRVHATGRPFQFQGPEGVLLFESDDGGPAEVTAEQLSALLREHAVPAMVLNACQSAMLDERADDPFASVAAALLKSGIRSVVAMAWSLYVSGAEQFLPAFYRRLFETGDPGEATRAGRQQMFASQGRVCARGRFPLQDWLVPVLYQQDELELSFGAAGEAREAREEAALPAEARNEENPYGFIGRDAELLKLERALRRPAPAVLIQGLGGVGKTTLARGFVEWLAQTEGLGVGCLWFAFNEIRSAEYVINRIGEELFGEQFGAAELEARMDALARGLREKQVLIVWDNFEVVAGIPGTAVGANLSAEDRQLLLRLLKRLRGGRSKVLVTSRSEEEWLGIERIKLAIGGLRGEERWEYCERILRDLGLRVDRNDPGLVELMSLLDGHPLAMRVVLPKLEKQRAGEIAGALKTNLGALDLGGDEANRKLYATLKFVEEGLDAELRPLLVPLALHERYVDANYVEQMAKQVAETWTRVRIDTFFAALAAAGLLRELGPAVYEMHPALTGFLRASSLEAAPAADRDAWARAFVGVMGSLADDLTPRQLHEQRMGFHLHGANFHFALSQAERLQMDTAQAALAQSLAAYAQNTRNFSEAREFCQRLAKMQREAGKLDHEAAAYHHLGMIAQEQRDFAAAEQWYRKSLAIKEKQGNEHGASTYGQLGNMALEQREFVAAEQWYRKALTVFEKQGNEHGAASTYGQLGNMALDQREFTAAEQWYHKALAIFEKQGNKHLAASTYHQLGRTVQEQQDFAAAEQWYRKALAIKEKQGNEQGAAITYHQLGAIAQQQRDFAAAEQWYHKALAIFEKQGNKHLAASTYHQLGRTVQEQQDFAAAEQWYRKSLAVKEKQGDEHGAAITYHQLGMTAHLHEDFEGAGRWSIRAIGAFARTNAPHHMQQALQGFRVVYQSAPVSDQEKLRKMWEEAGLGAFPGDG